ncbi:MAG: YdcF family protein, partial [Clostridiales bacterium]|nr:YdcF family protein [Clostridiales bacterium]
WLRFAVPVLLTAGGILFAVICAGVIRGMFCSGSEDLDYVVVLGAQVRGVTPSRALKKRLDKALEYAGENENTIFILSGGQGSGEDISEAECMRRYLTEHGISEDRLVLEDRSATTRENLEFSDRLTGCGKAETGILSNNFHIFRAVRLAEKQGYQHAEGIAAPSDPIMQVHYVIREVFALVKEEIVSVHR